MHSFCENEVNSGLATLTLVLSVRLWESITTGRPATDFIFVT
jgi:hypothetical protein